MITTKQKRRVTKKEILLELGLLLLAAFLFAGAFPNPLFLWGVPPLGFFCLIPLFILIHRSGWKRLFLYGFIYGLLSYSLFNYWLLTFHPLAILIVPAIYAVYFLFFLPILKLADNLYPKYGFLLQALLWVAYEFLKTKGFLGYAYGILGYTQFTFLPLIQVSSITGVWGVSLLLVFPQVFIAAKVSSGNFAWREIVKSNRIPIIAYFAVLVSCILGGLFVPKDFSQSRQWKVALVQQNIDPWRGGVRAYRESLNILKRLSLEAVKEEPEIIIWSETSFVPAIDWHLRYRTDRESYLLVRELIDFLSEQEIPYVIGNDDGRLVIRPGGQTERIDYNATILFEKGEIREIYRKIHLVPFTENFPYEKVFPWAYKMLIEADTHFWEKGEDFTVFTSKGVKFSTPICFEDTFGYLSRAFVREGAQVIVNLTNDSWSGSVASEMQHMAMAAFRAVENRRSMVRSSNGGMTCVITPQGKVKDILPPFVEGYLVAEVPVYDEKNTFYTRFGDWFAQGALVAALLIITLGIVRRVRKRWVKEN